VRNTLLAPKGYLLPIADSAQIEARLLAWIAGQNDLVEDFRTGGDPYSKFAMKLFQEKVWKPSAEEEKTPEGALAKTRRGFGKDTVLGAGFGLGSLTSYNLCRQNELLRPLFDSGEYDWGFIDKMIKLYRITYSQIPKFWKAVEKCFRWVTKYPNEKLGYCIPDINSGIRGETTLNFWKEGTTTIIQLPSGRRLFYRHATVSTEGQIKYIHGHLWGGSITENIIQSICRDLLAGWILECERQRIPVILHSYDEIIGCVPEARAEESLQKMFGIMRTGPDWAAGLPLDAEGDISPCFKK
jgi:DNA polymerase